jgi:hypothetical protein
VAPASATRTNRCNPVARRQARLSPRRRLDCRPTECSTLLRPQGRLLPERVLACRTGRITDMRPPELFDRMIPSRRRCRWEERPASAPPFAVRIKAGAVGAAADEVRRRISTRRASERTASPPHTNAPAATHDDAAFLDSTNSSSLYSPVWCLYWQLIAAFCANRQPPVRCRSIPRHRRSGAVPEGGAETRWHPLTFVPVLPRSHGSYTGNIHRHASRCHRPVSRDRKPPAKTPTLSEVIGDPDGEDVE